MGGIPMSSLPPALEDAWRSAQPQLTQARAELSATCPIHPRIIRVGQLDAELLDQELAQLIQEPITKALSLINVCFLSARLCIYSRPH